MMNSDDSPMLGGDRRLGPAPEQGMTFPPLETTLTMGQIMDLAFGCKNDADVSRFWDWYSRRICHFVPGLSIEEALGHAQTSIGYMLGYYDDETAHRYYVLLKVSHPILGAL